jgi:hypothetical protein
VELIAARPGHSSVLTPKTPRIQNPRLMERVLVWHVLASVPVLLIKRIKLGSARISTGTEVDVRKATVIDPS